MLTSTKVKVVAVGFQDLMYILSETGNILRELRGISTETRAQIMFTWEKVELGFVVKALIQPSQKINLHPYIHIEGIDGQSLARLWCYALESALLSGSLFEPGKVVTNERAKYLTLDLKHD